MLHWLAMLDSAWRDRLLNKKHDWYVLEISSFQLDGTKTFKPEIGILLNITPDHLDRYEYNMQNYVDSKFQMIAKHGSVTAILFTTRMIRLSRTKFNQEHCS